MERRKIETFDNLKHGDKIISPKVMSEKIIITVSKTDVYDYLKCESLKSNNWKKMHGIPLKSKKMNIYGVCIYSLVQSEYLSKRSKKKIKKEHFRHSVNICKLTELEHNPNSIRIYNRYGYARKKMMRKIKRLRRKQLN